MTKGFVRRKKNEFMEKLEESLDGQGDFSAYVLENTNLILEEFIEFLEEEA